MPTFIITAHIEFPSKSHSIQTGQIRMEIPADSVSEAHIKARSFIQGKTKVVIDKCENKANKEWVDGIFDQFKDIFTK